MIKKTKLIVCILLLVFLLLGITACQKQDIENQILDNLKCFYDGAKLTWTELKDLNFKVKVDGQEYTEGDLLDNESEKLEVTFELYDNNGGLEDTRKFDFQQDSTNMIQNVVLNNGIISWDRYEKATGYLVKIDNLPCEIVNDCQYEMESGSHQIQIRPIVKSENKYIAFSPVKTMDIILYPTLKFDKSTKTFFWDPVNDAVGYFIKIERNGQKAIDIEPFGKNATSYNGYDFYDEGTYKVSICARGDIQANKDDSKFYEKSIIRLPLCTSIKTNENDNNVLITWDKNVNADYCTIELPEGGQIQSDSALTYPLTNNQVEEQLHFSISYSSKKEDVLDSTESYSFNLTKLAAVTNLMIQGDYIIWDNVSKAERYIVNIDGTDNYVANARYKVDVSTGSHIIKIKAVGNGQFVISSTFSNEKNITKLSTPDNLSLQNSVLSWDSVNGCSSYDVIMDNGAVLYSVSQNSVTINRSDISKSCALSVIAKGNGDSVVDSNSSATKMLYLLDAPVVTVNKEGIQWDAIAHATAYLIRIGDYSRTITGTSYSFDEFSEASYSVYVTAKGDGSTFFDSNKSDVKSVRKLGAPTVNIDLNGVNWGTVVSATGYEVRIDGNTPEAFASTIRNKPGPLFTSAGTHTIAVRAIGDGQSSVLSSWTEKSITTTVLETPTSLTYSVENGKINISCDIVENASAYLFSIGGVVMETENSSYQHPISGPGKNVIKVAAKGDGIFTINSIYSQEKECFILTAPQNIVFNKQDDSLYTCEWNAVQYASSYSFHIKKYSGTELINDNTVEISENLVQIGVSGVTKIEVEIIAKGDDVTYFDSVISKQTKTIN